MKDEPELIRNIHPFGVRMPPDLKAKIEESARENKRSMNAEIVARLAGSFEAESGQGIDEERLAQLIHQEVKKTVEEVLRERAGEPEGKE